MFIINEFNLIQNLNIWHEFNSSIVFFYNLNLNVVFLTVIHIYIVDIETLEVTLKVFILFVRI